MNPSDIFALAIAAAGKAPLEQTVRDGMTVYSVVAKAKAAGKFDASVMVKDGSLQGVVEAAGRLLALMDALLKDPTQAARVAGLLGMFA